MPSPLPPASEILARTRQVYRECASYEDTGEVVSVYRPTEGYGYEHASSRYVIWRNGSDYRSWWTVTPEVSEHAVLTEALQNAGGVSGRASVRVTSLLLAADDQGGFAAGEVSVTRIERLEGVDCHVVTVPFAEEREETVWVTRDTSLIVRVDWEYTLDARSREQDRLARNQMLASNEVPEAMKVRVRASMERMADRDLPDTKVTTTAYCPVLDSPIDTERFVLAPQCIP